MELKQSSVVLRHASIASGHCEGVRVAWRWCGKQNDGGFGAAMSGAEANSGGVGAKTGGVETHLSGVETNFGGVRTSFDRAQAF